MQKATTIPRRSFLRADDAYMCEGSRPNVQIYMKLFGPIESRIGQFDRAIDGGVDAGEALA